MSYTLDLRSKQSTEKAFVSLINETQRRVDVFWINYKSQLIHYVTMEPDGRVAIDTYSTHPWIFRDSETGLLMQANNQEVFWPEPWSLRKLETRAKIYIRLPVQSLKIISSFVIAKKITKEVHFEHLDIPKSLADELKKIFSDSRQYQIQRVDRPT